MCHKRLEIVEASQGVVTTELVHGEYTGRIATVMPKEHGHYE